MTPLNEKQDPVRRPAFEVADIFRIYGDSYRNSHRLPASRLNVMRNIEQCRTRTMGGHVDECDDCGFRQNAYNSCGDRHCPKCRGIGREQWIDARKNELLPVGYFHCVFTLPHDLNPIILCNMKPMLDMLFSSVSEVLQSFAADPRWRLEGRLGYIGVLHTWNQTLLDHFHLHCLVPGGVVSDEGVWKPSREKFLFNIKSLAKALRARYVEKLKAAYQGKKLIFPGKTMALGTAEGFSSLIRRLLSKKWMVYAKKPFSGPEKVLEYLGRYTHRVALSNHRIESIDNGNVTFTYKDRKDENREKPMTLPVEEFIRRFLLHILPKGYVKIRYFGFLFHRDKMKMIALIRAQIDPDGAYEEAAPENAREIMLRLAGFDITLCPKCEKGRMRHILKIEKGGRIGGQAGACYD